MTEHDNNVNEIQDEIQDTQDTRTWQQPIKWFNLIGISILHIGSIYALITITEAKFLTIVWVPVVLQIAGLGVTTGAHRLWTHRSYKARKPLQIILLILYSAAGQNKLFDWVRDHRVHHKFSETSADPHNSNRGFFFAHVGWLLQKKTPEVIRKGKEVNMSDITNDPLLISYSKYFRWYQAILCFILPTIIPVYCWSEQWKHAILSQIFLRYTLLLNCTWSVNSFAHLWGTKPYDKNRQPVENPIVAFFAYGEGWHNYHHVFPWDYKAAEFGNNWLNPASIFINLCAKIGWAYDLKSASPSVIEQYVKNHGDGTHISITSKLK